MKKNVKYLGMAAAALLAVAPVVSSSTAAFAAGLADGNIVVLPNPDSSTVTPSSNTVKQKIADNRISPVLASTYQTSANVNASSIAFDQAGFSVVGLSATANVKLGSLDNNNWGGAEGLLAANDQLNAGNTYTQLLSATIKVPKANTEYTINGTKVKSSDSAYVTNVPVFVHYTVVDTNSKATPYFVTSANMPRPNTVLNNGAELSWNSSNFPWTDQNNGTQTTNVKAIYDYINTMVGVKDGELTTNTDSIAAQLKEQGVTVQNGGSGSHSWTGQVVRPNKPFYITYTATNKVSGKTATLKITFNSEGDYRLYPVINYVNGSTAAPLQQGSHNYNYNLPSDVVNVKLGANFNPTKYFTATVNAKPNASDLIVYTVADNVNTNVAGVYSVTLKATNPAGYSTTYTYNVYVGDQNGRVQTVDYIKGYKVNVWSVQDTNKVAFTNTRVNAGEKVTTFDTKTVNGVSYTRIGSKSANTWIQTQYLDGSWKNNKPATDNSSKEEAMSGVIVVKYNGKGKVALVDGNGKYGTGNYVEKNKAFKVFAKKTINGKTYYRLGTDKQWIPAQYAVIR